MFSFWGHFEAFRALSVFWGAGVGPKKFFGVLIIKTDNFYFVRFFVFCLFICCLSWVILSLLGPYRAILGVGSENFFWLNVYRLTTFVF